MIRRRPSEERGQADHGWLKSRFTFSFAEYHDPEHEGFRVLRVINEDWITTGRGFAPHPHRNMEIISYVVKGALEHRDSMGSHYVVRPGEVQVMSAGRGVTHSEMSPLSEGDTHLLQIWILPSESGGEPSYRQKSFAEEFASKGRVLVVSKDGREGSLPIKQDAEIVAFRVEAGRRFHETLAPGRGAWVQVVRGKLDVNGTALVAGDGAAIEDEESVEMVTQEASEFLFFNLP